MFLIAGLILGSLLRFFSLNQSLWLDEAITANAIKNSYLDIVTKFSPTDFHPPFYYIFLKAWSDFFGFSHISLRLPSVIFSLLSAVAIYLLVKHLYDRKTAIWSTMFFYFNPLIVYYSQEARSYSLVVLLFVLCLFFMSTKKMVWFSVCVFLSLATYYGSIFYLIPLFIYLLFKKQLRIFLAGCLALLVFMVIIWPLLSVQLSNSHNLLLQLPGWSSVLGRLDPKNLLLIPIKFTLGRISFFPKYLYWLLAFVASTFVFIPVFISGWRHRLWLSLLVLVMLSASIFALITGGGLQYFRLLFLIPVTSILLALFLAHPKLRILNYFYLLGFLFFSLIYVFNPIFHRENWQAALQSIPQNTQIFIISSFSDPVKYYRPDLQVIDLRQNPAFVNPPYHVIPYGEAIHGINHRSAYASYRLQKSTDYRSVVVEIWQ